MAYFRNNSKDTPLVGRIYVVQGSSISIKVKGLGPNGKRLIIKGSSAGIVDIEHMSPNDGKGEQKIKITGKMIGTAILHGFTSDQGGSALPGCTSSHTLTTCISSITVEVKPLIELKKENTDESAVTHMLLAESITPEDRLGRYKEEDALKAMQWMYIILKNRMAFSHPQLLQVPPGATTLLPLIKNGHVIEGFRDYPNSIGEKQSKVIKDALIIVNEGSDRRFLQYRNHVQNAIDVAKGVKIGTDPCPTKLYAWKAENSPSPGANFEKYKVFAGQDF